MMVYDRPPFAIVGRKSRGITSEKLTDNVNKVESSFNALNAIASGQFNFNPLYLTERGTEIKMLNQIVLQWAATTTEAAKTQLISQYGLVELQSTRLFAIYRRTNPLFVSQSVYESGLVRYCHPVFLADVTFFDRAAAVQTAFIGPVDKTLAAPPVFDNSAVVPYLPNDEYFVHQFNLHNTGQLCNDGNYGTPDADIDAPEAWSISLGDPSIVVAVLDYGVTDNHVDLPSSRQLRLPGSNFLYATPGLNAPYNDPNNPTPILQSAKQHHGNACAGVVAAEDNDEGIIGVAPLCKVMPVRINSGTFESVAESVTFAVDNGANVISASFGKSDAEPNLNATMVTALQDAIQNNVTVVFATGNDANHSPYPSANNPNSIYLDGTVAFPANADVPHLIAVGASDRNDQQANYSATSEDVDICATSSTDQFATIPNEKPNVWSLDLPGDFGLNDNPVGVFLPSTSSIPDRHMEYTGRFGGTSAAAPEVAGVAALMLSVNPCLSPAQVTSLLYQTTDKVGGYNYNWNPNRPGHSRERGHGRLNAYNAVYAAQQMQSATLDLQVRDTPNDFGIEPNTISDYFWRSEDIWVRNAPDGITEHQNPEFTGSQNPSTVYVRVANKSCVASSGTEQLKVYWAKAGSSLQWPESWDGNHYFSNNALLGAPIGSVTIPVLPPGAETVLLLEWEVPNPAGYAAINPEPWHFCLLARIEAAADTMFSEGTDLLANVRDNNNIAWKNITVIDLTPDDVTATKETGAAILVGNPFNTAKAFDLELIDADSENGAPMYEQAEIAVRMDSIFYQAWSRGGKIGQNLLASSDEKKKYVASNNTKISNICFNANEQATVSLNFSFLTRQITERSHFTYHVVQRDKSNGKIVGG